MRSMMSSVQLESAELNDKLFTEGRISPEQPFILDFEDVGDVMLLWLYPISIEHRTVAGRVLTSFLYCKHAELQSGCISRSHIMA